MDTIIEFRNTNFGYNNTNAFNDFNMQIDEGDIVTLVGPSGSGKTTLLKMLCHKLPNESCYYKGENFPTCNIETLKREVVVVFDAPITESNIKDEVIKYLKKLNFSKEEINDRYNEFRTYFSLDEVEDISIQKLSYSVTSLIKILRYLIIKPKFIAIDNLLSVVSIKRRNQIINYIKENKITLLNVSSNLEDSLLGNKLFVLENFVLILEGSTTSVLKADTLLKRLGFRLPLIVDLSIELIHYDLLDNIYTEEEKLVEKLWK